MKPETTRLRDIHYNVLTGSSSVDSRMSNWGLMPSIFAIANPKGGSGKTTVEIILAGEFAKHGYSVAIVDADPRGLRINGTPRRSLAASAPTGLTSFVHPTRRLWTRRSSASNPTTWSSSTRRATTARH